MYNQGLETGLGKFQHVRRRFESRVEQCETKAVHPGALIKTLPEQRYKHNGYGLPGGLV